MPVKINDNDIFYSQSVPTGKSTAFGKTTYSYASVSSYMPVSN